jgi:hypothetical protein
MLTDLAAQDLKRSPFQAHIFDDQGHMGFQGAVLIAPAIESGMRTNAIALEEDLNHIAGNPDINFLLEYSNGTE